MLPIPVKASFAPELMVVIPVYVLMPLSVSVPLEIVSPPKPPIAPL